MGVALFSYQKGNSLFHKIPAAAKIIFLFAFSVFVFWGNGAAEKPELLASPDLFRLAIAAVICAATFFLSGANWKSLANLRFVFIIGAALTALKMLSFSAAARWQGLADGLLYTARFFLAALSAQCVYQTTTPLEIQEGLRLPWIFCAAISFIPQIFGEWQKIKLAARARLPQKRRKDLAAKVRLSALELQALMFAMLQKAETTRRAVSNRRRDS